MAEFRLAEIPRIWRRLGRIIERGAPDEFDASVTGDPCIVWDDTALCWRMFYFAQRHIANNGDTVEANVVAHAVSRSAGEVGAGDWRKLGPITWSNPEALVGDAHKPWILMDASQTNTAALVDGQYRLFAVCWRHRTKVIQTAVSPSLAGPWHVQSDPVIDVGAAGDFDAYHVDTVTAFWFASSGNILLFYKGYPAQPQADQPLSPYGSSSACAILRSGQQRATKLGKVLSPATMPGHWTAGWIGGMQIVPARRGGWYGLINASPTPPPSPELSPSVREPAPSLGGWAYTPEEWPVRGWQALDGPMEWIEDVPRPAQQNGEGVNLWRHHLLALPGEGLFLYYNSGAYGQERMFGRRALIMAQHTA